MTKYAYSVLCVVAVKCVFGDDEVSQESDGREGDLVPTAAAMKKRREEFAKHFRRRYTEVGDIELDTNSDCLMYVTED